MRAIDADMGELINSRTPEEIRNGLKSCTTANLPGYGCNVACPYLNIANCWFHVKCDALSLIERLETQVPKWISVEERLPESGELVLVTMNGEIHGAKLFNLAYELACYYREGEDEEGEYHIDGWELWDYRDGEVSALEVFYWMPLPEPPEEEGHG